ncbi:aspartate/glutamate racemase family protein [Alkalicoccus chagannorensis]|uniref:aspartate/glutamate racemase family protein n=1 Tax=Alkalicoccus chagannorensis TaxID=427072 RepID=UPI000404FCF8|nr:amino acid racemase [Alkalicoccus chagannorensis]
MRRLGLVGGMSWETTLIYYRRLHEEAAAAHGPLTPAPLLLDTVDFPALIGLQDQADWTGAADLLGGCARRLEAAGAEAVALCSNTAHLAADGVQEQLDVPLLSIVDAVLEALPAGTRKPLLLGTAYTMQSPLFTRPLEQRGMMPLLPTENDQQWLQDTIFEELAAGIVRPQAQDHLHRMVAASDADCLLLACTELTLFDYPAGRPKVDSLEAHVGQLSRWMLADV